MFQKFLLHVLSKSKPTRDRYAFFIASTFTLMVAGVWLLTGSQLGGDISMTANLNENNAPFSQLFSQIKDQFGNVKEGIVQMSTSTADMTTPVSEVDTTNQAQLELTPETIATVKASAQATSSKAEEIGRENYIEVLIATSTKNTVKVSTSTKHEDSQASTTE